MKSSDRSKLIYEIGISILAVVALTIAIDDVTGRIDSTTSAFWCNIDLGILLVFATVIVIGSLLVLHPIFLI